MENKILVIRGGAIGDFILTLPVLSALRLQFPKARLEVLGYPHIASLALAGRLADAVRPIESRALAGFFASKGELEGGLKGYFGSFAIIISFLYDPDGIFQANVARCSSGQFIAGPHRPMDTAGIHATEVFLKPLERLTIFDANPVPCLNLNPETNPGAALSGAGELALHPGSGSEGKNWPEQRWAELLDRFVKETTRPLLLVGGEAEGDRIQRLASRLPAGRVGIAVGQPLPALAARLAQCRGFVGHDSGISHLAAALGVPTVILWGPSVEGVWRPRNDNCRLVKHPAGLAATQVQQVVDELQRFR